MPAQTTHVHKDTVPHMTFYEIFSLDPAVTHVDFDSVHRAYRRFALLFHPDKDPSPAARVAFERVKLAAETLTDPQKRQEYNEELQQQQQLKQQQRWRDGTAPSSSSWQQQQQQQQRQEEEEARVADMILRQKEAMSAAKAAETRREEAEKEAAARLMLHELTESLTTPFKQMEAVLVHEWDIDEDLLEMKEREVESLLWKLREYNGGCSSRKRAAVHAHATRSKRERMDA